MPSIWKTGRSESICVAQPSLDIIAWDVLSFRLRGSSITSKHPQVIMIGKIKQLFQLFQRSINLLLAALADDSCWRLWDSDYILACFPNRHRAKRLQYTWSNVFPNWICAEFIIIFHSGHGNTREIVLLFTNQTQLECAQNSDTFLFTS